MKTLLSIVAALAAITSASVAFAHDAPDTGTSGHYEWQSRPTFGPHTPLTVPTRVWVSDTKEVASCDCAMMHVAAMSADCMAMPHKGASTTYWPAAGLMDTEIRCFIELEEQHATKKAQPRVQA